MNSSLLPRRRNQGQGFHLESLGSNNFGETPSFSLQASRNLARPTFVAKVPENAGEQWDPLGQAAVDLKKVRKSSKNEERNSVSSSEIEASPSWCSLQKVPKESQRRERLRTRCLIRDREATGRCSPAETSGDEEIVGHTSRSKWKGVAWEPGTAGPGCFDAEWR